MYLFKWRLFDNCNFKCSYCINSSPTKQEDDIVYERLINQAKSLNELIENNNEKSEMLLIGGELTILPLEVMENILNQFTSPLLKKIRITTNFSGSDNWYVMIQSVAIQKGWSFALNPSLHEEFYNIDRFFEKLLRLKPHIKRIQPEVVVTKENQELVAKFVNFMKENDFEYLVDYDRQVEWSEDEKIFESNPPRLRSNLCNSIDTFGMTCSNSIYQLNIRRGIMYGSACQARKPIGVLGMTKTIKKESMICPRHKCSFCGLMTLIDKDGNVIYSKNAL